MSKRKSSAPAMMPGQDAGEKFMAVLLWAQKNDCECPACEYFRELAGSILERHFPKEAEKDG